MFSQLLNGDSSERTGHTVNNINIICAQELPKATFCTQSPDHETVEAVFFSMYHRKINFLRKQNNNYLKAI